MASSNDQSDQKDTDLPLGSVHSLYVDQIVATLKQKGISYRELSVLTNISRSRLHSILHPVRSKRRNFSLPEFFTLMIVLDMSFMFTMFMTETAQVRNEELQLPERQAIELLAKSMSAVPALVLEGLSRIGGLDTADVRMEWSGPLSQAVANKLCNSVSRMNQSRDVKIGEL